MLNKSKGKKYSWGTHTRNAIKGQCEHECSYCYMNRWGNLKVVRLEESEFRMDLERDNVIFVGNSTDDFSENIPGEWVQRMLGYCASFDNRYLFQSKDLARILQYIAHHVFRRSVVCTAIESKRFFPDMMNNAPQMGNRMKATSELAGKGIPTYVTCEPLMQFDLQELVGMQKECKPQQVKIGRNFRRDVHIPEPTADEVKALIAEVGQFTKVAVKKNAYNYIK